MEIAVQSRVTNESGISCAVEKQIGKINVYTVTDETVAWIQDDLTIMKKVHMCNYVQFCAQNM